MPPGDPDNEDAERLPDLCSACKIIAWAISAFSRIDGGVFLLVQFIDLRRF